MTSWMKLAILGGLLIIPGRCWGDLPVSAVAVRLDWEGIDSAWSQALDEEEPRDEFRPMTKEIQSLADVLWDYLPAWRFEAQKRTSDTYPRVEFVLYQDKVSRQEPVKLAILLYVAKGLGAFELHKDILLFDASRFNRIVDRDVIPDAFRRIREKIEAILLKKLVFPQWEDIRARFCEIRIGDGGKVVGQDFEIPLPYQRFALWIRSEFELRCEPAEVGLQAKYKDRICITSKGRGPSPEGRVLISHLTVKIGEAMAQPAVKFPDLGQCVRGVLLIRKFIRDAAPPPNAPAATRS